MHPRCHVLTLFLLVVTACASTRLDPLHISEERGELHKDERALWTEARAHAEKLDANIVEDATLTGFLDSVVARLSGDDFGHLESQPRVRVIAEPTINAFALPDGSIYVFSGMLTSLESEGQLAAILGHEITHYTHRHALREKRGAENLEWLRYAGIAAGTLVSLGLAAVTGIATTAPIALMDSVHREWMHSAIAGYSRDLEREADDVGFQRALEAGYHPDQFVEAFEIMRDSADVEPVDDTPFYRSHPAMSERLAHYEELLAQLGSPLSPEPDQDAYRHAIAAAYLANAGAQLARWELDAARADLDVYQSVRPDAADGHMARGRLARKQGDSAAVQLQHFRLAAESAPSSAEAWREVALCQRHLRELDAARTAFRRAAALDPSAVDAPLLEGLADLELPQEKRRPPPASRPREEAGLQRVALVPTWSPPGLRVDAQVLAQLDEALAEQLDEAGIGIIEAERFAELEALLAGWLGRTSGAEGPSLTPEERSAIEALAHAEIFVRYDVEVLVHPVLTVERARLARAQAFWRDEKRTLDRHPDAGWFDWDLATGLAGTVPALSLRLVAVTSEHRLARDVGAGIEPLAMVNDGGTIIELPQEQRFRRVEDFQKAAALAVSELAAPE